jgi:hypothetical protein
VDDRNIREAIDGQAGNTVANAVHKTIRGELASRQRGATAEGLSDTRPLGD